MVSSALEIGHSQWQSFLFTGLAYKGAENFEKIVNPNSSEKTSTSTTSQKTHLSPDGLIRRLFKFFFSRYF